MGNCGACCFFCCIDPIARSGKGTAHVKTESVRSTKNHIKRAIKYAKRDNKKTTWVDFSNQVYPPEVQREAVQYYVLQGYTVISTPDEDGRATRITVAWK